MIPIAVCAENGRTLNANIKSEEIGEGNTFLFGLDLQRQCSIGVDSLIGQIYLRAHCYDSETKTWEKKNVPIETVQCRGSGLLMFRGDRFEDV